MEFLQAPEFVALVSAILNISQLACHFETAISPLKDGGSSLVIPLPGMWFPQKSFVPGQVWRKGLNGGGD
ncbi:hypothetical protein [Comamonas antarctica]|uniref:Uncharacterized protein n=1 Tax=Comamonas antarctica TaxID=2743470 RepID=A0A6N1X960_9BURK|nr:hypothetical protein [Comamonas antarctica]QKV54400.1 hypothetical protein HUK68_16620 [Comamonas antarctica]